MIRKAVLYVDAFDLARRVFGVERIFKIDAPTEIAGAIKRSVPDVKKYFPSIDVEILRDILAARIRDQKFMAVVDRVLEAGRGLYDSPRVRRFVGLSDDFPPLGSGLPIGALTSQFFAAHVYLQSFDHFVKRALKVPAYVRYVDDFFLFGDRRADLRAWRAATAEFLWRERRLRLKFPEARVRSCAGHMDALGVRIRRVGIEPLPRKPLIRLRTRIRREIDRRHGDGRLPDFRASFASFCGTYFSGM